MVYYLLLVSCSFFNVNPTSHAISDSVAVPVFFFFENLQNMGIYMDEFFLVKFQGEFSSLNFKAEFHQRCMV